MVGGRLGGLGFIFFGGLCSLATLLLSLSTEIARFGTDGAMVNTDLGYDVITLQFSEGFSFEEPLLHL